MEQLHGIWGNRLITFQWSGGISSILFLEPRYRCSWHKHDHNYNQFVCIQGTLGIKTDKSHTTLIREKQTFTVEPGVWHEFQTYKDPAIVEEIAYVKYNEYDIFREKLGSDLKEGTINGNMD